MYAKYKQISEDVVMDALATVRFHEEHAMYYLLATNTLAEDIAVSNVIQITRAASPATSGFARFGLARALVLKHGMGVQAVHDLLEFTKKKPVVLSDSLSTLPAGLKTSAGCEPRLLHFDA